MILTRNKLTDKFAMRLQCALTYDKYIKVIDLAGNKIGQRGLKTILKLALLENNSIIAFDVRLNPGCTEKVQRQFALCMLKNIEKNQARGIEINQSYLKPELYSYDIPSYILKRLKLPRPGEKPSRPPTKSRGRFSTQGRATTTNRTENNSQVNNSAYDAYNSGQINLDGLGVSEVNQ